MSADKTAGDANFVLAVHLEKLSELSAFIGELTQLQTLVQSELNGTIDLDLAISAKTFKKIGDSVRKSMRSAYQEEFANIEKGLIDLNARQQRAVDAARSAGLTAVPTAGPTMPGAQPARNSYNSRDDDHSIEQLTELRAIHALLKTWNGGPGRRGRGAAPANDTTRGGPAQSSLPGLLSSTGTTRIPATSFLRQPKPISMTTTASVRTGGVKVIEDAARTEAVALEKAVQAARRKKSELAALQRKLLSVAATPSGPSGTTGADATQLLKSYQAGVKALEAAATATGNPSFRKAADVARVPMAEIESMRSAAVLVSRARATNRPDANIAKILGKVGIGVDAKDKDSVSSGEVNLLAVMRGKVTYLKQVIDKLTKELDAPMADATQSVQALSSQMTGMRRQGAVINRQSNTAETAVVAAGTRSFVLDESQGMGARLRFANGEDRTTSKYPQGSAPVGGAKKILQDFEKAIADVLDPLKALQQTQNNFSDGTEFDRAKRALGLRESVMRPTYDPKAPTKPPIMSKEALQAAGPELASVFANYANKLADEFETYYTALPKTPANAKISDDGMKMVGRVRDEMPALMRDYNRLGFLDDTNLTKPEQVKQARAIAKGPQFSMLNDDQLLDQLTRQRGEKLAGIEQFTLALAKGADLIQDRLVGAPGEADRKRLRADRSTAEAASLLMQDDARNAPKGISWGGGPGGPDGPSGGSGRTVLDLGGFDGVMRVNVENVDELAIAYALKMNRINTSDLSGNGNVERVRNKDGTMQHLYEHPDVTGALGMRKRHLEGQTDWYGNSVATNGAAVDIPWELSPMRATNAKEALGYAKLLERNNLQFNPHTEDRQRELMIQMNRLIGKRAAATTESDQLYLDNKLEQKASQIMSGGEYLPKGAGVDRGVFNGMALSAKEKKDLEPRPVDFTREIDRAMGDMRSALQSGGVAADTIDQFVQPGRLPKEFRQSPEFAEAMRQMKANPQAKEALSAALFEKNKFEDAMEEIRTGKKPNFTLDTGAVAKVRPGRQIVSDMDLTQSLASVQFSTENSKKILGTLTEQTDKLGLSFSTLNQLTLTPFLRQLDMLAATVEKVKPAFELASTMIRTMGQDSTVGKQMRKVMSKAAGSVEGTTTGSAAMAKTPDELKKMKESAMYHQENFLTSPMPPLKDPGTYVPLADAVAEEERNKRRQEMVAARASAGAAADAAHRAYVGDLSAAYPNMAIRLNDMMSKNMSLQQSEGRVTNFDDYDEALKARNSAENNALQNAALADDRRRQRDLALTGNQNARDALISGRGDAAAIMAGSGVQTIAQPAMFTNLTEAFDTILPARAKLKSSFEAWQNSATKSQAMERSIIEAGGDPNTNKAMTSLRATEQRQLMATIAALETFERVLQSAGTDDRKEFGMAFSDMLRNPLMETLGKVQPLTARSAALRQSMATYSSSEAELAAIREKAIGSQQLSTADENRIDALVNAMNKAAQAMSKATGVSLKDSGRRTIDTAVNYLPEANRGAGNPMAAGAFARVISGQRTVFNPDMEAAASAAARLDTTTLGVARNFLTGTQGLKGMKAEIDSTSNAWGKFKNKVENLAMYMGAGGILYTSIAAVQRAFREAMQFETDIADLKGITMGSSAAFQQNLRPSIEGLSQEFGVGRSDVTRQVKTFAQAGFTDRSIEFSRAALTATKGLGIEPGQASEMLVANENVTGGRIRPDQILDKISRVERTRAVSAQDLSVAIQRAGSIVEQLQPEMLGGIDPQDFLIGAVTEIVQKTRVSGNQAATSLRFMLSRLAAPDVAKSLQEDFKINLGEGSPDTLRPASDILGDIAGKYKSLMAQNKSNDAFQLLTSFAGARQVNAAAALFGDWDRVMATAVDSSRAFGDAQMRLALQMDTLATKTTQLQDSFFSFVTKLMEDTILGAGLKKGVDVTNSALKFGTENPELGLLALMIGGPLAGRGAVSLAKKGIGAFTGTNTLRAAASKATTVPVSTVASEAAVASAASGGPKGLLSAAPIVSAAAETAGALTLLGPKLMDLGKWLAPRVVGGLPGLAATAAASAMIVGYKMYRGMQEPPAERFDGITENQRRAYGSSQESAEFVREAGRFGRANPASFSQGITTAITQAFADVRKDPRFAEQAALFLDPNKTPDMAALKASKNSGLFRELQARVGTRFSEVLGSDFAMIGGPVRDGDADGAREKRRQQYEQAMKLVTAADRYENQGAEAYTEEIRGRAKDSMPSLEAASRILTTPFLFSDPTLVPKDKQTSEQLYFSRIAASKSPEERTKMLDFELQKIPKQLSQALGPQFGSALLSTYFENPGKSFANQLFEAARKSGSLAEALSIVTKRMFTLDDAMMNALAGMKGGFSGNIAAKGTVANIDRGIADLDLNKDAPGYAATRAALVNAREVAGNVNAAVEARMAQALGGDFRATAKPTDRGNQMAQLIESRAKAAEQAGQTSAAEAIRALSEINVEAYNRLADNEAGKVAKGSLIRQVRTEMEGLSAASTREATPATIRDKSKGRNGGGAFLNDVALQPLMEFTQRNMTIQNTAPLAKRFGFEFDAIGERYQAAVQFMQASAGIEAALFGQEMTGRRQEFIGRMGGIIPEDVSNLSVMETSEPGEEGRLMPGVASARRSRKEPLALKKARAAERVSTTVRAMIESGKGEQLSKILGADGMAQVLEFLPQLAGKSLSALVPMTKQVDAFLALFDNPKVKKNVDDAASAFSDFFKREDDYRKLEQKSVNDQARIALSGQTRSTDSQLAGLRSQLGRDPMAEVNQALRDVLISAEAQLEASQALEMAAQVKEELEGKTPLETARKRTQLEANQVDKRANMLRTVAESQRAITEQFKLQMQLRLQSDRDGLRGSALSGLKQDLAGGFKGKAFERTANAIGGTFNDRISSNLVENLLGVNGVFGDLFGKLFQSDAMIEANLIRDAHIAGIQAGFSAVYGTGGVGPGAGAMQAPQTAVQAAVAGASGVGGVLKGLFSKGKQLLGGDLRLNMGAVPFDPGAFTGGDEPKGKTTAAVAAALVGKRSRKKKALVDTGSNVEFASRTRGDVMNPIFLEKMDAVMAQMRAEGHNVQLLETYRGQARQEHLYAQGRTRPGPEITWTRNSKHKHGMAADIQVNRSWQWDRGYERLQEIASEQGLRVLGAKDPGHIELVRKLDPKLGQLGLPDYFENLAQPLPMSDLPFGQFNSGAAYPNSVGDTIRPLTASQLRRRAREIGFKSSPTPDPLTPVDSLTFGMDAFNKMLPTVSRSAALTPVRPKTFGMGTFDAFRSMTTPSTALTPVGSDTFGMGAFAAMRSMNGVSNALTPVRPGTFGMGAFDGFLPMPAAGPGLTPVRPGTFGMGTFDGFRPMSRRGPGLTPVRPGTFGMDTFNGFRPMVRANTALTPVRPGTFGMGAFDAFQSTVSSTTPLTPVRAGTFDMSFFRGLLSKGGSTTLPTLKVKGATASGLRRAGSGRTPSLVTGIDKLAPLTTGQVAQGALVGPTGTGSVGGAAAANIQATFAPIQDAMDSARKAQLAAMGDQLGASGGMMLGSILGSKTFGKDRKNGGFASVGSQMGSMIGMLGPPVIGPLIGGLVGGLLGGLLGEKKEKPPEQFTGLEMIERNTRETITAIENQTRVISLDSRFLNAPGTFAIPSYSPLGVVGSDAGMNITINVNGATAPQAVAQAVAMELRKQAALNGRFTTTRR